MQPLALSHAVFHPPSGALTSNVPLVILHGLFGSKQNWRSLSKAFAQKLGSSVVAVDLRNHGESPHSPVHTFDAMSADVDLLLDTLRMPVVNLMGHSMGGKTAMHYALEHQNRIEKLVVVDIAPSRQRLSSVFGSYVQQMKLVDQSNVKSPAEADKILSQTIKEQSIRQFLLTNLKLVNGTLRFRVNLDALGKCLKEDIAGFPHLTTGVTLNKPSLFLRGTRADYIPKSSEKDIQSLFPQSKLIDIDAGHW
ncbi:hypothetical protein HDU67_005386 [Dinochytrium kinnereticum]|nr:hypothetical protein HDU67_005386 [Dinochytrium kinnereticum]